jgi:hypothetical protein
MLEKFGFDNKRGGKYSNHCDLNGFTNIYLT